MSKAIRRSASNGIYLGRCDEVAGKRAAINQEAMNEILARINKSQVVLQAQLKFGDVLDYYIENYVRATGRLSVATQGNYERLIKARIRPAWDEKYLGELQGRGMEIERWLANLANPRIVSVVRGDRTIEKLKPGMAHHTRNDIRNLMSGIFTQARRWQLWKAENPMEFVSAGKKETVRPARKLTIEETRDLLNALPADVRTHLRSGLSLLASLRISEALGLTWRHIDFARSLILVRQRFYRGDLGETKNAALVP